jgi:hypothetical protein
MSKLVLVAAGIVGISMLLLSQEAPAPNVPVQVTVTAEALHGKGAPSLSAEDFMAYQRHERLQVTNVVSLQGDYSGLELFVLLDDASASSLATQFGDLRQFMKMQPATTAIGIGYMRNGTVDIVQSFTADHNHAAQSLRLPLSSFGAMASPYLSLSDLIKHWPGNSMRREVVLVSSGVDPLGGLGTVDPYLDSAIEDAQRNGIIVYAIYAPGLGHSGHSVWRMDWGQSHLAQLAEETGGEAYMLGFGAPVSVEPYLADITEHLGHQFRVTFLMKPGKKPEFQDVRFVTEVANAELVSAHRVYVPGSR